MKIEPRRPRFLLLRMLFVFCLLACVGCVASTPPMVSMHEETPLNRYTVLEVPDAVNKTGQTFDFDPCALFTQDLRSELAKRGYQIATSAQQPSDALVVQCSMLKYQPGSPGKAWLGVESGLAEAMVKTTLKDKKTGNVIGTMLTPGSTDEGLVGFVSSPDKLVLASAAAGIATEIDKRMKND